MRLPPPARAARAFTLIEIMMVVAIMALILGMGIPSLYQNWHRHGIGKAVDEITQVCVNARKRAIMSGTMAEIVFHPKEKRFEVSGGVATTGEPLAPPSVEAGTAGQFTSDITISMLDINMLEYNESDLARVRFFPNGTSDEMTLILESGTETPRKISLEVITAIASVDLIRR